MLYSKVTMHNADAELDTGSNLVPSVTYKSMDTADFVNTSPTQMDLESTEVTPGLKSTSMDQVAHGRCQDHECRHHRQLYFY